jgi:hypothetical protein
MALLWVAVAVALAGFRRAVAVLATGAFALIFGGHNILL